MKESRFRPYDYWLFGVFILLALFMAIVYAKRVVYPDSSFDTINYHFFLGKSGYDNFPLFFSRGEFYPLGMHGFNPLADMAGYLSYLLLGYRLGTINSLLSLLGVLVLGYGILRQTVLKEQIGIKFVFIACLLVPAIFTVNDGLFQLSTYFTDNIYLFISISLVYILLRFNQAEDRVTPTVTILIFGVLAGLLITKLTNVIYFLPIYSVFALVLIRKKITNNTASWWQVTGNLLLVAVVVLLVNYYFVFTYMQTGNPVFPYYNSLFKSIYYPEVSWPFNFGPKSALERIFYPFYSIVKPTLLGEVKEMFPDRKLLIIFFYNTICIFYFRKKLRIFNKNEHILFILFYSSFFLWQLQFGYSRYGMPLEIIGGIVSLAFIRKVCIDKSNIFINVVTFTYGCYLLFQMVNIFNFNLQNDVAWRPTPSLKEWSQKISSSELLVKYTTIPVDIKNEINKVQFVMQCGNPSSAYGSLIRELNKLPLLNFDKGSNRALTRNRDYAAVRDLRLLNSTPEVNPNQFLQFVAVSNAKGGPDPGVSRERCIKAIEEENHNGQRIVIEREQFIDNFVGDASNRLSFIFGRYYPTNADKK